MDNTYGNELLHKVLLSAMKDIDKVCRENNISYYLHAGTLLGAMNYKGFIPWDDDVDISFLRDDYETFISIMEREYADKYFIHNYHTDSLYKNNRTVLRVLGTKINHYHKDDSTHSEIGLDIVPLDCVPDSTFLRKVQQGIIWILDAAVQIKQGDIIPCSIIMKCIALLAKVDRCKLGENIDRVCMAFNKKKTTYIGLLSYTGKNPYTGCSGYENDLMCRKWFESPIYVDFEDTQFMTISNPIDDLEHRYGPHWGEPYPEEKRATKHDVKSYEVEPWVKERIK